MRKLTAQDGSFAATCEASPAGDGLPPPEAALVVVCAAQTTEAIAAKTSENFILSAMNENVGLHVCVGYVGADKIINRSQRCNNNAMRM